MAEVCIATTTGSRQVDALRVAGVWALHPSHPPGAFVITHVPTGRALIGHREPAALHAVMDQLMQDDAALRWESGAAFRDAIDWSGTAVKDAVALGLLRYHRYQWMRDVESVEGES